MFCLSTRQAQRVMHIGLTSPDNRMRYILRWTGEARTLKPAMEGVPVQMQQPTVLFAAVRMSPAHME